jgi:hypothetical protein
MNLSDNLPGKEPFSEKWKEVYGNPHNLVEIRFSNATNSVKYVWLEPAAYSLEPDANTEYKLLTHERHFSIEYSSGSQFTFQMDYAFGFVLYKRSRNGNSGDWTLDVDMSDIEFPK